MEEAGAGERGRECESEIYSIYIYFFYVLFHFIVILNVPSCLSLEPRCRRKFFIFMLCILMNNKD